MGSHYDKDHKAIRQSFIDELKLRSEIMTDLGKNRLQNEKVQEQWFHDEIQVQRLPDDRQGILRISIGGGDDLPIRGDYCNFRGDQSKCITLLERVLNAMKSQ